VHLYHGTTAIFDTIDLSKSHNRRDFGVGFYTTTIKEQAERWAKLVYERYGGVGCYLNEYDFRSAPGLSEKHFEGLTLEWLEMIKDNRIKGGIQHGYDIVRGPVANDNTMPTIALYFDGLINAEAAINQLRFFKANDQVSFHTQRAINCLHLTARHSL
jgi:hypothetical protein